MKNNKILFLGNANCPLFNWLVDQGEDVMQTTDKISLSLLNLYQISFIISYGYRHIITSDVIQAYQNHAINLHISLLPWNKGCSPNLWSFVENTPKGVSIHYIDEGIDTGDIIAQEEVFFVNEKETLTTSYNSLHQTMHTLFKKHWSMIKNKTCNREVQNSLGTYHNINDEKLILKSLAHGWHTPIAQITNLPVKPTHF